MKRRLLAFVAVFAIIFTLLASLSSCGEKYEPVESTDKEAESVIKISYEKETYEVPYELYRAFFLQFKGTVDGGDNTVWSGAEKEKYEKAIDELIGQRIAEIYGVFHLCEKADINVYSRNFDKAVKESIEDEIDGRFGGDYDKYLASLKEMNHNYSTAELMIRYHLARQSLMDYYVGPLNDDSINSESKPGKIQYTRADVLSFYQNESQSRCIIMVELPEHLTKEEAEAKRDALAAIAANPEKTYTDIIIHIANNTLANPAAEVIGKYTYDTMYYGELTENAFATKAGEVSDLFTLKTLDFNGYAFVYRLSSDNSFFEKNYEDIAVSYILNKFGETVSTVSAEIMKAMTPTDALKGLDRSKVTME